MPRSTCIVKKRNKAAKTRNCYVKRQKILQAIENASSYVPEDAHLQYFANLPEEKLPELHTEREEPVPSATLSGNRLVDISYFIDQIRKLTVHDTTCIMGKMTFLKEKRNGLVSHLSYYCSACNSKIQICTQNPNSDLNSSFIWGVSAVGTGYSQADELFSILNVPMMTKRTYRKNEMVVHKKWDQLLLEQMKQNAIEERNIAIEEGHIEQGIPYITVIVDGSWAKRSYGHSYSSLSGVACIIGQKTKKLLYIGVKNKFCYMCVTNNREHECYKNYSGPSTSMEQAIIVEGFNKSESDYGLRYKYVVGDGDSSVYTRILDSVHYGRYVTKLECANHATRAFTSNLYKLIKNKNFDVKARNVVKSKISSFSGLIRTIISRATDAETLRIDLKNSTNHILGNHEHCRKEICSRDNGSSENCVPLLTSANVLSELDKLVDNLIRKSDRLTQNVTTNAAERYMSMIAKFTGGKRTNLIQRGVYQHRCLGAGLAYNSGVAFHKLSSKKWKTHLERFCSRRLKKQVYKRTPKKRKTERQQQDMDYGENPAQPDMDGGEFEAAKNRILAELDVLNFEQIQQITIGQRKTIEWFQARRNRITASCFGRICTRRAKTPCHNLIKQMLYRNEEIKTKSILYGVENEKIALSKFETLTNVKVKDCGFFVSKQYCFLGASPDGITETGELIEVKCLYSVKDKFVTEAVRDKKTLCVSLDSSGELTLKQNHHYYYQIQGQLNICEKEYCYLILYTDKDLQFLKIKRDSDFWENKMLPKLILFWENCMLPELADPRIPRGLKARDITVL